MANNKISNLINYQVPGFVRRDHQQFVTFLEHYYKYMEQANTTLALGGVLERSKDLLTYIDIDNTHDDLAELLYEDFMRYIPRSVMVDKDLLIKNILDFYTTKGTEKGLKFLLRILLNRDVKGIYYPKSDVLKASDGKWYVRKSLRIENIKIDDVTTTSIEDLQKFINSRVTGQTSGASAIVEDVNRFFEVETEINELFLSSIRGTFSGGETISATYESEGTTHTITGEIFLGVIISIEVTQGGSGYQVGDPAVLESLDSGTGGTAIVSRINSGNISNITIVYGGAGFQVNNNILISGGGGTGANGKVTGVDTSESVHPNTYNLYTSTISIEANTTIANAVFSNLSSGNANTAIANALEYFTFTDLGPIAQVLKVSAGSSYTSIPSYDVQANTMLKTLGVLGRMDIDNAGTEYRVGDVIEFTSSVGYGANAIVAAVNQANSNSISQVLFVANAGWAIGGFGYSQASLPTCNIRTTTGSGGVVSATAILGDGEVLSIDTNDIGRIEQISVITRGRNYEIAPTVNLAAYGSGTAQAVATILTSGVYTYPGYYLNDDGHISAFNFLQNRDYYQNYSYVIRIKESLDKYIKAVKNLANPSGMKPYGEYMLEDVVSDSVTTRSSNTIVFKTGTYVYDNTNSYIEVTTNTIGYVSGPAYLEILSGNLDSGIYTVANVINTSIIHISPKYEYNANAVANTALDFDFTSNSAYILSPENSSGNLKFGFVKGS